VHHLLLDRGLSHPAVAFSCVAINIGFIVLAWFTRSLGTTYVLLIMLAIAFSGLGVLYYYRRPRRTMIVAKTKTGVTELKTSTRVVALTEEIKTKEKRN
jgi:hypothetical protein